MKRLIIFSMIFLLFIGCVSTKELQQVQFDNRIELLEQRLEETKVKNSQLDAKLAELEKLAQEQTAKGPSEKTEACEKLKLPVPVAPVRPVLRAYINQQIADGPLVLELENCTDYIWMSFEINGVFVECLRNGFPNVYATDSGRATCLPPKDRVYIILPDIRGTTTITVNGFIGITPPLKYQGKKILSCKFYPSVPHHQVARIDRFGFQ